MELRRLRYFVALGEELHFGRAARRLHVVQPALSQQLRSLEEEIGVPLVDRTTRSVTLTAAGVVLLGQARRVLADVEQAVLSTQRAAPRSFSSLRRPVKPTADVCRACGARSRPST